MAPSSSAKKVARLASRGKGKKVRFQGGSVFPIAVAIVVVLGLLAIVYGRESRPSDGSGVPRVNDGANIVSTADLRVSFNDLAGTTLQRATSVSSGRGTH